MRSTVLYHMSVVMGTAQSGYCDLETYGKPHSGHSMAILFPDKTRACRDCQPLELGREEQVPWPMGLSSPRPNCDSVLLVGGLFLYRGSQQDATQGCHCKTNTRNADLFREN
jgi:hypothetical protein